MASRLFNKSSYLISVAGILAAILSQAAYAQAETTVKPLPQVGKGPLNVFILADQSNMDGQANFRTVDFLSEDEDPARAALPMALKPGGKNYMTRDDVWGANESVYDKLQAGFGERNNYGALGSNIRLEYGFVYYMDEALNEHVSLINSDTGEPVTVNIPWSRGLWDTTHAVDLKLEKGTQTLRISAPLQRAITV